MFARLFCFGLLFCASALTASALIERAVERTFPVSGRVAVKVDTFYGSIQVKTNDASEVHVIVHQSVDAKTEDAADRQLRSLDLAVESPSEGRVNVLVRNKHSLRWTWEKWPPVVVAIEISVPKNCDLDLLTREGGIIVGDVRGDVNARALQGAVFIGEADGAVTAWSAQGDVSVTACTGKLEVTARAGNVVIGRALGPTEISGTGGAVELQTARGPLRVEAGGGDLKVGFAYSLSGDAEIRAMDGDVLLTFDPKCAFSLKARSSNSGKVVARDLPLSLKSGKLGSRRIEADLNGGGHRIAARTFSGSVRILGVPAVSEQR